MGIKGVINNTVNFLQKAEQKVESGIKAVGNEIVKDTKAAGHAVADTFSAVADKTVAAANYVGIGKSRSPDAQYDGKIIGAGGKTYPPGTPPSQVDPVLPNNGKKPTETIIYTNGILTDKATQEASLQTIANTTGAAVIGIHNSTDGAVRDLEQCVGDKADKGKNPAVDTLADTIYSELKAGHDVHLIGHSQGGLITARALEHVQKRLQVEDGMSKGDAEKLMGKLKVETFGAASTKYVDGPKYVHYVNKSDVVPMATGLGISPFKDPGKGAVVHYFNDPSWNLSKNHSIDTTYMEHRVPFDAARQNQFPAGQ